jgi:hypothetical protein
LVGQARGDQCHGNGRRRRAEIDQPAGASVGPRQVLGDPPAR